MNDVQKWLKNYWYYYKTHTIIAALVAAAGLFLLMQNLGRVEPDYHVGIVTTLPCREETLARWEAAFCQRGVDRNGDGQVMVQIHPYPVDLANPPQNTDTYQIIAQLDADLVGKVSGIFLVEDPEAFQTATNGALAEPFLETEDGLFLAFHKDAPEEYRQLWK
jgi:hypothetical protein